MALDLLQVAHHRLPQYLPHLWVVDCRGGGRGGKVSAAVGAAPRAGGWGTNRPTGCRAGVHGDCLSDPAALARLPAQVRLLRGPPGTGTISTPTD